MSELKTYTEEELAEHQQLYDEVFTPVWESEGQYCRAGGGQYEKSFAWWAFKYQQSKVDELTLQVAEMKSRLNDAYTDGQSAMYVARQSKVDELQKRVEAVQNLIREWKEWVKNNQGHNACVYIEESISELEQALKGGIK